MKPKPVHLVEVIQTTAPSWARIRCDASEAPIAFMLADGRGGIRTDGVKFATDANDVTCAECKAAFWIFVSGRIS